MIDVFYDDLMIAHDPGAGHPERPDRLKALRDGLKLKLGDDVLRWRSPTPASREAVERVHFPQLVSALEEVRGQRVQLDPDTSMSPESLDAAYLAAGAAINASIDVANTVMGRRQPGWLSCRSVDLLMIISSVIVRRLRCVLPDSAHLYVPGMAAKNLPTIPKHATL
mgnify:CR=1 FL=1